MYLRRLIILAFAIVCALPASAQVTFTRSANLAVDVSKDGRLAIDLRGEIWVVPSGGGDARQLTQGLKTVQHPRWSPDGEQLVYEATSNGRRGIWLYNIGNGEMRSISANSNFDLHPAWHPDGERVIYASDKYGTGIDLWEIDLPTGLRWRVSDRPGDETAPAWSSDGRDLVYVYRQGEQWSLILRRHAQPEEVLLTSPEMIAAPSWRPDSSLITFFRSTAGRISIDMIILSRPRLIRSYAADENFVVSPVSWLDRHRMYFSSNGEIRQRLFNSRSSSPLQFRASIRPKPLHSRRRERHRLPWIDEPPGKFVVHASRLFDGTSDGYRHDKDIVIEGGRIISVEDHAERSGVIVINMGDLTVLPGFVDADARLPAGLAASYGPELLTTGVTTLIGTHPQTEQLNSLWSGRDVPGPRLLDASQWHIRPLSRPEFDVTAAVVSSRSTNLPAGQALQAEFREMQVAGLTPLQTLRAVGVNAAAALLADPYLGRIAAGAAADLVFVDGDPLADIFDALNVVAIIRNGRFYSVSGLIERAKNAQSVE